MYKKKETPQILLLLYRTGLTTSLIQLFFLSMGMICYFSGAYAQSETEVSVQQLLQVPSEATLMFAPAIQFYKASGTGTEIQKVAIAYYGTPDCSGTSLGAYTTPDGSTAFPISGTNAFSLNSASVWKVATNSVIPTIPSPQNSVSSIQVNFRSITGAIKANFSTQPAECNYFGNCCVPVTCSDETQTCSNSSFPSPQPFTFTIPQAGDPYGSGVVYRTSGNTVYIISLSDVNTSVNWESFPK